MNEIHAKKNNVSGSSVEPPAEPDASRTDAASHSINLSELQGEPLRFTDASPRTLVDALTRAAATDEAIHIVTDKFGEKLLSYRALLARAKTALGGLQHAGAKPGRAVILQLDELDEFLVAFWACVLGGLVPVPVLPFRTTEEGDSSFRKLQRITGQLDVPVIVMSDRNAAMVQTQSADAATPESSRLPKCQVTTFTGITEDATDGAIHQSAPNDLAFLQFTSGSTSFPKGTRITHENVLATIQAMVQALGVSGKSSFMNWMPFYHDMGIIAGHLMPLVSQCKLVVMKPFTFVRRPLLWLKKIHEHRITVTFSPNFGLRRILEKARPEQIDSLDLSCLEVILNGAEPISVQTCDRFVNLLSGHCGLRRSCMVPGYGLAEASLAVSIALPDENLKEHVLDRGRLGVGMGIAWVPGSDSRAALFADEGPVVAGMSLRVVDDNDEVLPENTVGHVQICGTSVTQGYFANDEANEQAFCNDWFRTGDLGFVHNQRFVITGRIKDVVFVNGQNYYSHDFEHACEDIEGLDRLVVIGYHDHDKNDEIILAFVACDKKYSGAREITEILRAVQIRINQCFDVAPSLFVLLKSSGEIPKTTSGKIIRHKLLDQYLAGDFSNQCIPLSELREISPDLSREEFSGKHVTIAELKLLIRSWWSQVLDISQKAIGDHDPFFSLGGTSIKAIEVLALAEEMVDCVITHDMFKEYDTIHRLANYIARENIGVRCKLDSLVHLTIPADEDEDAGLTASEDAANETRYSLDEAIREDDIAIIGMGCIFPEAENASEFWQLLMEGRDCVSEFPDDRHNINRFFEEGSSERNRTISKWGSFIESHYFDPKFFNLNEQEAVTMDPHQRVFLSAAWQAIQDSGLVNFEGSKMGVFVGASGTGFYQQREDSFLTPSTLTGALANLAAARVSNAFNLKGPSLSVDTACSSSLVSVDLACKSILNGESDTAIAGGVQILESIVVYLMFSSAGILSPDGKCHTFSDKANGFVPGEGAGAVVLKRYRQAIEDGDRVYAVIKASATNNDGASLGIMSPNPEGQETVIRTALSQADIDPSEIGYVEAHGTGTNIGDLIEVRSLALAFNEKTPVPHQSCAIGSVKTNMGHQLAAAGISGLMKAALAIYHGEIPASLNCDNERQELKLSETPFFVCHEPVEWPKKGNRRLAAVNSFGFGGTNAHAILSSAYHEDVHHDLPSVGDEPYLFCLSAKTGESLDSAGAAFSAYAGECTDESDARHVAYTYAARRAHYRQNRIAVVADRLADAALLARGVKVAGGFRFDQRDMPRTRRRIAWMFSGQGSQAPAMAKTLYSAEPEFRDTINICSEIASPLLGRSLKDLLINPAAAESVNATEITQPLVFTMDYAVAKLWQSWGVKPDYMLGHSIGEYVAACMGGMFSLEDALKIVVKRGALMGALPAGGGMTAVLKSADEVGTLLDQWSLPLDISACNAPDSTVVSGDLKALSELHGFLDKASAVYQPLQVSHAFHSRHMEPMLAEYKAFLTDFKIKTPATPLVSNVTGQLYQGTESSPEYWVQHIRQPVQMCKGIQTLSGAGAEVFMELGNQAHLTGLARRVLSDGVQIVSTLPRIADKTSDERHLAITLGKLYVNGVDIDWIRYYESHGDRRCQNAVLPQGQERRCGKKSVITGGQVKTVPAYSLERRSMFRIVGEQKHPFRHLFRSIGEHQYAYVPSPDSVLFRDHVVARSPMLSGAGQCDLIGHLHAVSFAHSPKCLRNLSFHQPWLGNSQLTVSFSGDTEKEFAVTDARGNPVFKGISSSFTRGEAPWSIDVELQESCLPHSFNHEMVYDTFSKCGMEYGDFHRHIVSMRASSTEVIARLRPPESDRTKWTGGYFLHPGILDSAFQATAGALMASMSESGETEFPTMVPVGIGSICIFKFIQEAEYVVHVTFERDEDGMIGSDMIKCNIRIYDKNGVPCVHVDQLQLKRMPSMARTSRAATSPARSKPRPVEQTDRDAGAAEFFQTVWTPGSSEPVTGAARRWLVFGAPGEMEQAVSSKLASAGLDLLLVPFNHYRDCEQGGFEQILEKAGAVDGVLYLGDYDLEENIDEAADVATLRRLFYLLKAASAAGSREKTWRRARFMRATREIARSPDIRKSLATGFLRTARIEFPLLDIRQVDLGNIQGAELADVLRQELGHGGGAAGDSPESMYLEGQRHVLKIEPVEVRRVHERASVFSSDKTFWIIGGTSGVGQVLARHLADRYQPTLILSGSRRLPEPDRFDEYLAGHDDGIAETIRFIRTLEACGSQVRYVSLDVRSRDSIRLALDDIRNAGLTVNGIYFGALQLNDKMILQKDWPGYRNMLDMRVNGLNHLVDETRNHGLDFFVSFSSLAGLTGNIGQSDYAAGNVFMDQLPGHLGKDTGCRYITVQWGAWSLGQQVSDIVLDHMNRNGFLHISAQLGMEALEKIILGDQSSVAFVPGSDNAHRIAKNINQLRLGLATGGSRKKNAAPVAPAITEEQAMNKSAPNPTLQVDAGQVGLLMNEFDKQREMLMKLCESQNALLANALGGSVTMPVAASPAQAPEPAPTPVPVVAAVPEVSPPAPEVAEVYPDPIPVVEPDPVPATPEPVAETASEPLPENLFEYVRALMARAVDMHPEDIDPDQNFMELGADSMTAMSMVKEMEQRYSIELPATLLFEYATLNELVDFLKTEVGDSAVQQA